MSISIHEDDKKPKKNIYIDIFNPNKLNDKLEKYMNSDDINKYYDYYLKNIVAKLKTIGFIKNQPVGAEKMKQINDYFTYSLCLKALHMISRLYDNLEAPSPIVLKAYRRITQKKVDSYLSVEKYQWTFQNSRFFMICDHMANKALEEFPFEIITYLAKK